MAYWPHIVSFHEDLKARSELFPRVRVIEIDDNKYTSKTCEECGILNNALRSSRRFKCLTCVHTTDRNLYAVRNILLNYSTWYRYFLSGDPLCRLRILAS